MFSSVKALFIPLSAIILDLKYCPDLAKSNPIVICLSAFSVFFDKQMAGTKLVISFRLETRFTIFPYNKI